MTIENPFLANKDTAKRIRWCHLSEGVSYQFEFICPSRAMLEPILKGGYLIVAAQVKESQITQTTPIEKDELLLIDLPVKAFSRAWSCISVLQRKSIDNRDNVLLSFIKKNEKNMFITSISRLQPSDEQRVFADDVYSKPELYLRQRDERSDGFKRGDRYS